MNGKTKKPVRDASRRFDFNDPDEQNAEQAEAGTQAQDVASDAMRAAVDLAEDSEPGGKANPAHQTLSTR